MFLLRLMADSFGNPSGVELLARKSCVQAEPAISILPARARGDLGHRANGLTQGIPSAARRLARAARANVFRVLQPNNSLQIGQMLRTKKDPSKAAAAEPSQR